MEKNNKMHLSFQRDFVTHGFSWPQRNYTCTFCKKEYKSAQALGGHMNIHRRDRAKLMRELSPSSSDLNPSPNPNFSSTPTCNNLNPKPDLIPNPKLSWTPSSNGLNLMSNPNTNSSFPLSNGTNVRSYGNPTPNPNLNPNPNCASSSNTKFIPLFSYGTRLIPSFGPFAEEGKITLTKERGDEFRVLKKRKNILNVDLGLGLINEAIKEDLDLELRLGFS